MTKKANITFLPAGGYRVSCHFHPRCSKAMAACCIEYPKWTELGEGRGVACHLYT